MKILSIESSAKAASVAVSEDGKLLSQYYQASGLTHSRTLLAMAEDLLKNLELTVEDMDGIAVAKGPGSFTGVRIGVAAAKGLAWGADKPVYGVSTLEAMAYNLIDRTDCVICCAMDARRNQIYNAVFESDGEKLTRLSEDRAIAVTDVIEEAKKSGRKYIVAGDGARICHKALLEAGVEAYLPQPVIELQNAWGVYCAALNTEPCPSDDIKPEYIRLSQAERERLERLKTKENKGE